MVGINLYIDGYFFLFSYHINEIVWRTQTEEFWVNFKVWGILPLTFLFTAISNTINSKV